MRADMFMVDTKTGRIWQMVNSGPEDQKKLVLQPIAYVGVNGAMPMPEDTLSEVMVEMGKSKAAHPELGGMFDYMMRSIAGMSEEEFKKGNPQTQPAKKP